MESTYVLLKGKFLGDGRQTAYSYDDIRFDFSYLIIDENHLAPLE
jgi:hypothetical protein